MRSLLLAAQLIPLCRALTCYTLGANAYGNASGVTACNKTATGEEGSHSACCHASNSDACLSSGLCLNTLSWVSGHTLWSTGCTDPTFKDPACPQVCFGSKYGSYGNYHLRSCDPNGSNNTWCCGTDDDKQDLGTCCENSFKLPVAIGTVTKQLSSGSSSSVSAGSSSSATEPSNKGNGNNKATTAYIAVVCVESVLLALAIGGLLGGWIYVRKLQKQLPTGQADVSSAGSALMQFAPSTAPLYSSPHSSAPSPYRPYSDSANTQQQHYPGYPMAFGAATGVHGELDNNPVSELQDLDRISELPAKAVNGKA